LREGERERPRADLDPLRQPRQSAGASGPHPQRDEERGRGESARVRSDAEITEADRAGEPRSAQGTQAPAPLRSFFCIPYLSFHK